MTIKLRRNPRNALTAMAIAGAALFPAVPAQATDYDVGSIHIAQPWARATPKGATAGAGYMKITNKGTTPDRLTCMSAAGASQCQVHTMTMEQGVMKMRPLTDGLEIKPGETVELKPSAAHMMFMGLKQPLVQGASIKVTLKFQNAGTVDVDYAIQSLGASSAGGAPSKPGMGGMKM